MGEATENRLAAKALSPAIIFNQQHEDAFVRQSLISPHKWYIALEYASAHPAQLGSRENLPGACESPIMTISKEFLAQELNPSVKQS